MAIDPASRIVGCNPAACKLLGRSPAELMHQPAAAVLPTAIHPEPNWAVHSSPKPSEPRLGELDILLPSGVVHLVSYRLVYHALPDLCLVTLRDIGDRRQMEEQLRQQTQREHLLRGITQRVRQSLSVDVILSTAVDEVRQVLQVDRALIFRLTGHEGGMVIQESVNPDYPLAFETVLEDRCFAGSCREFYQQHKTRVVDNVYRDDWAGCLTEYMQQFQIKSKMVAAILQRNPIQPAGGTDASPHATNPWVSPKLWGLLIVHSCGGYRQWQPSEADLLQHIADQIAIALQQAELYHQVQQLNLNLEDKVQQRTVELKQSLDFEAMLRRISDRLRDSLDERQILQTAVQELAEQLHLDTCEVGFFSGDSKTYQIVYEFPINLPPIRGLQFRCEDHHDLEAAIHANSHTHSCGVHPLVGWVGLFRCPIADEQGNLGILTMVCPAERIFTEQEIRLAEQVAIQCAIAIRQARLFQAAQTQVAELERLNKLKDDFLDTVSHELRTPLSNITMATQMLEITLRDVTHLTSDLRDQPLATQLHLHTAPYLQILKEESLREISLINDLLDLARIESETEPLMLTTVDLRDILPHIAEPFLQSIHSQQQQLDIHIPDDLVPFTTDLNYLERILSELLHNACKYTPAGETIQILIETVEDAPAALRAEEQATVAAHPLQSEAGAPTKTLLPRHEVSSPPRRLRICITNTGVEIPNQERDRIFEKFYRIPNNDPWKHGGTGLGLALVKKLATLMGGRLWVESAPVQTTFVLEFPLDLPQHHLQIVPRACFKT
ncbi:MAG: hypothetical protein Fur0046_30040 [Cyanobacteria bacterium J069]